MTRPVSIDELFFYVDPFVSDSFISCNWCNQEKVSTEVVQQGSRSEPLAVTVDHTETCGIVYIPQECEVGLPFIIEVISI